MCERKDHDLLAADLVRDREREPIEDVHASVEAGSPLCRGAGDRRIIENE
jgi:hypothetical protein